ncbi:MAG: hypothetical protein WC477_07360 [Patescibacteria group bacterium]
MYRIPPKPKSYALTLERVILAAVALCLLALLAELTVRAMSIEDAANVRRSILMQEAPETLTAPRRADFMSDACYARALRLFNERGDWATDAPDNNYSEMELCD